MEKTNFTTAEFGGYATEETRTALTYCLNDEILYFPIFDIASTEGLEEAERMIELLLSLYVDILYDNGMIHPLFHDLLVDAIEKVDCYQIASIIYEDTLFDKAIKEEPEQTAGDRLSKKEKLFEAVCSELDSLDEYDRVYINNAFCEDVFCPGNFIFYTDDLDSQLPEVHCEPSPSPYTYSRFSFSDKFYSYDENGVYSFSSLENGPLVDVRTIAHYMIDNEDAVGCYSVQSIFDKYFKQEDEEE